MATSAQLGSVTVELINRLDSSIIAKGTGLFIPSSLASAITNIRLGFIYSTQPISITTAQSISNTTTTDTLVPISGQVIDSLMKPEIYSGTSSSINWDYSVKIDTLLPNTTYYVRAYCSGYYDFFTADVNKYGEQFSISTGSDTHGYYISDTTVGFYDPLQIRDSNEGVERVLTTDSSGLATWKPVKSLFSFGHYIGEKYGGGIVAAVWKEGDDEKVLIVSNEDITSEDGAGIIGSATSVQYKMGTSNYFNNPGSAALGSCYLSFHNNAGTGPYAGGNPQNIEVICIHNFDNFGVNQADFFLSFNGTGSTVTNPLNGIGNGVYQYSTSMDKGLIRIKGATTTNIFRVVGCGTYASFIPAPAKFIASDYNIRYVGPGTVPGTTMGVFRIYVDYLGTETTAITTGVSKNFPAAQEILTLEFDSTGTGLNYLPLSYMKDFKWVAGVAQSTTVGPLAQSLYNGDLNTDAIIAQSNSLNTIYSAAKVCADYKGSGYDDWYLPAYYELNQVFNNAAIINKVLQSDSLNFLKNNYWTSTEFFLPPGSGPNFHSANAAMAFNSYNPGTSLGADYIIANKASAARVRAVRKESVYTGDGLIMNLDATIKKSFSDVEYLNVGTSSKWKDLVNGGLTSSYSFPLASHPTTSTGGTFINILPIFTSTFTTTDVFNGVVGGWTLANITSTLPAAPKMYNKNGASSYTSGYFVGYSNTTLKFDAGDYSSAPTAAGVKVAILISEQTPTYTTPYYQIREITLNSGLSVLASYVTTLYQYEGKTISVKITSPGAYFNSASSYSGPMIDTIYLQGTVGGYQAIGPVYFQNESGFLRFNGQGTSGAYVDFQTTVGNTTTVTVEAWVRLKPGYSGNMIFGWNQYDVYCTGGHLGFNTNSADLYGISATQVTKLNLVNNWNHYVFEMKTGAALGAAPTVLSNNKIYINGNEQILSNQLLANPNATNANFNSGQGRIGGFRFSNSYFMPMDMSVFRIYNRPLTKDEIMKNYSVEKKRYEILPKLLENNIFTSIDFDNPNSYSGDGTITGTVTDLSGNSRNATLTISGTTTKPAVQRTNTLYNGKELIFPGTTTLNPYLSWPNSVDFQNIQNLSVSFWVKFTERRNSTIIVRWNNTTSTFLWEVFQSQSTGTLSAISFRLKTGVVTFEKTGTKGIPLNKWTHVCATFDNTTKKMKTYIDSVLDINSAAPSTFAMATGITGDVIVGRYLTPANPMKGSLASIQIYNKSLGYGEVRNNYDVDKFRFDDFDDANKFFSHEINGNPTFSISQNLSLEIGDVSNEKILKLNTSGYSKWTDKNAIFSRPANYRYIGELYGGGIIVAMWYYPKDIFNYLIMSLEDVSASTQWSNVTNAVSNATSDFKGETNQTSILTQSLHTSSAAKLCDNYAGGGFTDWYLPSVFEMNQAFNAGNIVDTVLGSDSLAGSYWTSTEINATDAYYYSCSEVASSVGYQKSSGKVQSKKVRAFRLATNAVEVNIWDTTWDEGYTPWWRGPWRGTWREEPTYEPWLEPTYWDIDWQPATYNEWDFDYFRDFRRTSISIDVLPAVTHRPELVSNFSGYGAGYYYVSPQGYFSMTFSNTIYGGEAVLSTGVCWSTTSTTPTLSDSVAYTISGKTKTPDIMMKVPGTPLETTAGYIKHFTYLRAFVTTPTGTYYSSNSGVVSAIRNINEPVYTGIYTVIKTMGTTYSTSATTYATYPTGCLVFDPLVDYYNRS